MTVTQAKAAGALANEVDQFRDTWAEMRGDKFYRAKKGVGDLSILELIEEYVDWKDQADGPCVCPDTIKLGESHELDCPKAFKSALREHLHREETHEDREETHQGDRVAPCGSCAWSRFPPRCRLRTKTI